MRCPVLHNRHGKSYTGRSAGLGLGGEPSGGSTRRKKGIPPAVHRFYRKRGIQWELGLLNDWTVFNEPEEHLWPDAVRKREVCGRFTAITWFRSMRVPQLFSAHELRESGATALVDSYFDKLVSYYLGADAMEWLISPSDPYYEVAAEMARLDRQLLPDADVVVMFEVTYDTWRVFLERRGRKLDQDQAFLQSFPSQQSFIEAVEAYCHEASAELVRFHQTVSSPKEAASTLANLLSDRTAT